MLNKNSGEFRIPKDTDVWIFDFDDTLYPANTPISMEVERRTCLFIARELGMDEKTAFSTQKKLYRDYSTTLRGLMTMYNVSATKFLDFVYDIDYPKIEADPVLKAALDPLEGQKYIFTNNLSSHVEYIAKKLKIFDCFEGIFGMQEAKYIPKFYLASYLMFFDHFALHNRKKVLFDDIPQNLTIASQFGITTILVEGPETTFFNPTGSTAESQIDHTTKDLIPFLQKHCSYTE